MEVTVKIICNVNIGITITRSSLYRGEKILIIKLKYTKVFCSSREGAVETIKCLSVIN